MNLKNNSVYHWWFLGDLITACKRSCGRVMFSQVSVCPQGDLPYPLGLDPSRLYPTPTQTEGGRYASNWNAVVFGYRLGGFKKLIFKRNNSIHTWKLAILAGNTIEHHKIFTKMKLYIRNEDVYNLQLRSDQYPGIYPWPIRTACA